MVDIKHIGKNRFKITIPEEEQEMNREELLKLKKQINRVLIDTFEEK